MMRMLRRGGFVTITRGQAGGYALSRPAGEIRVVDVLAALGGRLYEPASATATLASGASAAHARLLDPLGAGGLQQAVDQVLGELTLASLLPSESEVTITLRPRAVKLPIARHASCARAP